MAGILHEDLHVFVIICNSILLRMRNILEELVKEIITYILYSIILFLKVVPFVG
jgi:hypothetical protein